MDERMDFPEEKVIPRNEARRKKLQVLCHIIPQKMDQCLSNPYLVTHHGLNQNRTPIIMHSSVGTCAKVTLADDYSRFPGTWQSALGASFTQKLDFGIAEC